MSTPHTPPAASTWAQRMLAPDTAVILDVETCAFDGAVCEVAVLAADTGTVLLNTLVDPLSAITPAAHLVHGITSAEVAAAPCFPQILPQLEAACHNRIVIAYNAEFDWGRIRYECDRWHTNSPLTDSDRWDCAMIERSTWLHRRHRRHLRLGGNHRALGDVQATRTLMLTMAGPAQHSTAPAGTARCETQLRRSAA